ncbi:MAG: hypothetical protein MRY32_00665 [Rickettsiales bacterium]|nr:hypothetical protein [Rickettsiales bacterium]
MSISSWGVFTLCSVAAFLYALKNNGDLYFIATSFICLSGNVVILTLAILAQVKYRIQLRSMQPVTQII